MMPTSIPYGNALGMCVFTQTIDPASVSANTSAEQDFTVSGLLVGDVVMVRKPTHTAGFIVGNARVKAANTLSIQFANITGSPIDASSETYTIIVWRVDGTALTSLAF